MSLFDLASENHGISVGLDTLKTYLSLAGKVIPRHTTSPILKTVHVTSGGLFATDTYTWAVLNADGDSGIDILVDYKEFSALVGKIPKGCRSIRLEPSDSLLLLKSGGNTIGSVESCDGLDYPVFRRMPPTDTAEISPATLNFVCQRLVPCCSTDPERLLLNNVLVEISDGRAGFAATDGHILALLNEVVGNRYTVPRDMFTMAIGLKPKVPAVLSLSKHRADLSYGPYRIATLRDADSYPDYRRVVPRECIHEASFRVGDLDDSISTAVPVNTEYSRVCLDFKGSCVDVSGCPEFDNPEPCPCTGPSSFHIGFDRMYVDRILSWYGENDMVTVHMNCHDTATLWTGPDNNFKCVLMPIKLWNNDGTIL